MPLYRQTEIYARSGVHIPRSSMAQWQAGFEGLCDALLPLDPKARLAWYGPAMSARSFATARLMETWAHGQDVWDVLRRRRPASNRLKHIAHLGVTTLGWTFANRGLPVPPVSPYICLDAPDGSVTLPPPDVVHSHSSTRLS